MRSWLGAALSWGAFAIAVLTASFTPDGARLFAASGERRALRWEVSLEAWMRHACRVAGRELTQREWQDTLPGRPYRPICRTAG